MKLKVNYNRSIESLIKDNDYNYVNPDITNKNFPRKGKGTKNIDVEFFNIKEYKTTEQILKMIEKDNLEPLTIHELLTFSIQYPDEQRKHPIAALGSAWVDPDGYRHVGYLYGDADGRYCYLYWGLPERQWSPDYVFAVRRRKPLDSRTIVTPEPLDPLSLEIDIKINGKKYVLKEVA
jgi:hypothetical protein